MSTPLPNNAPYADVQCVPLDVEKIKLLRERRGLSQEDAARLAGLAGKQRWNKIEKGLVPNITLATLEAIAKALGCRAGDLLK